jgi:hypothetical protein
MAVAIHLTQRYSGCRLRRCVDYLATRIEPICSAALRVAESAACVSFFGLSGVQQLDSVIEDRHIEVNNQIK